ncbi:alpha/beta-hydrolase [Mycena rebaudengoi]|nr:alpha/beta-hydrolase [Mycena rebaudengoi]
MYKSLLSAFLAFGAVVAQQPSVTIKNGTVRGVSLPHLGQDLFLGIPFAQPPVGDLRLAIPQSINTSFGTLDATVYGPHCWSRFTTGFDDNSGFSNSEDCLTLNVVRPHGISEKNPVPVLVWIHGGGLSTGGSADFRYNGTWMVQASVDNGKPIVFVSVNYRLASLGFLGGKTLQDGGLLNLGFRDQRLALHWVQENIAKFGGNPKKVTIQGESVHAQVIAYQGRDDKLFNQAVAQSGTGGGQFNRGDAANFQATYNALLANTTCASTATESAAAQLSCIRALPIDVFRKASVGSTGLALDGDFINSPSFFSAYRSGKYVKAAFIVGSNSDEGRSFSASGVNTTAQVTAALTSIPAQFRDAAVALYPDVPALGLSTFLGVTPGAQNKRLAAINGDVSMAAGPRALGQIIGSRVPVYKYTFNHIPWSGSCCNFDYIGHFLEVGYVFNTQNNDTDFWITNHFTATYLGPTAPVADRFLGVYMSRSWAAFAATGDPNNANVPSKVKWPQYSDGAQEMLWQTQGSITRKDNFRGAGMQFIIDHVMV